jgi:hypothetical protein
MNDKQYKKLKCENETGRFMTAVLQMKIDMEISQ